MKYYIVKRDTDAQLPYLPYFEVHDEGMCSGRWIAYISPKCLMDHKTTAEWIANNHHGYVAEVTVSENNPRTGSIGG